MNKHLQKNSNRYNLFQFSSPKTSLIQTMALIVAFYMLNKTQVSAQVINHCKNDGALTPTYIAFPSGANEADAGDEVIQAGYECTSGQSGCATVFLDGSAYGRFTIDLGASISLQTIIFLASHDQNWSYQSTFTQKKTFGDDSDPTSALNTEIGVNSLGTLASQVADLDEGMTGRYIHWTFSKTGENRFKILEIMCYSEPRIKFPDFALVEGNANLESTGASSNLNSEFLGELNSPILYEAYQYYTVGGDLRGDVDYNPCSGPLRNFMGDDMRYMHLFTNQLVKVDMAILIVNREHNSVFFDGATGGIGSDGLEYFKLWDDASSTSDKCDCNGMFIDCQDASDGLGCSFKTTFKPQITGPTSTPYNDLRMCSMILLKNTGSGSVCQATQFMANPFQPEYQYVIGAAALEIPLPVLGSDLTTDDDPNCGSMTLTFTEAHSGTEATMISMASLIAISSSDFAILTTTLTFTITAHLTDLSLDCGNGIELLAESFAFNVYVINCAGDNVLAATISENYPGSPGYLVNLGETLAYNIPDPDSTYDTAGSLECGTRLYSIQSVSPVTPDINTSGAVAATTLTPNGQLVLSPTSPSEEGLFTVTVRTILEDYSSIASTFDVEVEIICVVTSLQLMVQNSVNWSDPSMTYYISEPQLQADFEIILTPLCLSYSSTFSVYIRDATQQAYCTDTDTGALDTKNDGCDWYDQTWKCNAEGRWDDTDFISSTMCCFCSGGYMDAGVGDLRPDVSSATTTVSGNQITVSTSDNSLMGSYQLQVVGDIDQIDTPNQNWQYFNLDITSPCEQVEIALSFPPSTLGFVIGFEATTYSAEYYACSTCDYQCYLDRYIDLQISFGPTNVIAAENHYISGGENEGRICCCNYDIAPCGAMSFELVDPTTETTPAYIQVIDDSLTSSVTIEVETANTNELGVREVCLVVDLTEWTPQMPACFDVEIFKVEPDTFHIDDQIYTLGIVPLEFSVVPIILLPLQANETEFQYNSTLADGSELPAGVIFDELMMQFTVLSLEQDFIGQYDIVVTALGMDAPLEGKQIYTSFSLVAKVNLSNLTTTQIEQLPFFDVDLEAQVITVGDSWVFTLPKVTHPNDLEVTFDVDLLQTSIFALYDEDQQRFTIQADETTSDNIGIYQIYITIVDELGYKSDKFILTLQIEEEIQEEIEQTEVDLTETVSFALKEAQARRETYKDATFEKPTVAIKKITNIGQIILSFSNTMYVPRHYELISGENRAARRLQDDEETHSQILEELIHILDISIVSETDNDQLYFNSDLTWNVTSYTKDQVTIQLHFDEAVYISSHADADKINISFIDTSIFFDFAGQEIDKETVLIRDLPPQLQLDSIDKTLAASAEEVQTSTQLALSGNFIWQIALSASLQQIWSLINTQQIIVLIPLFKISLPSNIAVVFSVLMHIASFDIFPTEWLFDKIFKDLEHTNPLTANFEAVGFESLWLIYNLGSITIIALGLPFLMLFVPILRALSKYFHKAQAANHYLKRKIFWNAFIRLITESYTILIIGCMINSKHLKWYNFSAGINSILVYLIFIVLISYPIFIVYYLNKYFDQLNTTQFKSQFGEAYQGLALNKVEHILYYITVFFFRRALISATVVYTQHLLILQIFAMNFTIVASIFLVGGFRVFKKRTMNQAEFVNEIVLLLVQYCAFIFSDFILDAKAKHTMGYVFSVIILTHLAINFYFIFRRNMKTGLKQWKVKKFLKKALSHVSKIKKNDGPGQNYAQKRNEWQIAYIQQAEKQLQIDQQIVVETGENQEEPPNLSSAHESLTEASVEVYKNLPKDSKGKNAIFFGGDLLLPEALPEVKKQAHFEPQWSKSLSMNDPILEELKKENVNEEQMSKSISLCEIEQDLQSLERCTIEKDIIAYEASKISKQGMFMPSHLTQESDHLAHTKEPDALETSTNNLKLLVKSGLINSTTAIPMSRAKVLPHRVRIPSLPDHGPIVFDFQEVLNKRKQHTQSTLEHVNRMRRDNSPYMTEVSDNNSWKEVVRKNKTHTKMTQAVQRVNQLEDLQVLGKFQGKNIKDV